MCLLFTSRAQPSYFCSMLVAMCQAYLSYSIARNRTNFVLRFCCQTDWIDAPQCVEPAQTCLGTAFFTHCGWSYQLFLSWFRYFEWELLSLCFVLLCLRESHTPAMILSPPNSQMRWTLSPHFGHFRVVMNQYVSLSTLTKWISGNMW
jgi:hypothetical protein